MGILSDTQLQEVSNAVLNTIGYNGDIRSILLSGIDHRFTGLLPVNNRPVVQIGLDLMELNRRERLDDGTVPLEMWLNKAANFIKPFPAESRIVQQALADTSAKTLNTTPIQNPEPPSPAVIDTIVKEKTIHKNDMLSFSFLQGGAQVGVSVARMQVPRHDNGVPKQIAGGQPAIYLGTGWLLTKELVITNHHVINARNSGERNASKSDFELQAASTVVQFDFDADNMLGNFVKADKLEAADENLDYAIIRLKTAVERVSLVILSEEILVNNADPQGVNIIQHPLGYAKKVALRNNHIYDSQYPKVRYFTDTEGGSSGSPVFNDNWQVIALHRASTVVHNVQYNGQATAWVNEGVQLKAILDHLTANHPDLAAEIIGQ